jgi:Enoyl-(Acyl carrier protein) reductase
MRRRRSRIFHKPSGWSHSDRDASKFSEWAYGLFSAGIASGRPIERRATFHRKSGYPGHNAAFQVHAAKFADLTEDHFDQTLKTNLYGYFPMARAAVEHMAPGSAIVNTGSVTGILGNKDLFLASAQCSSYITGEVLPIIGGYSGG